ncbi:hypothetical protein [Salinisphaera japonica]|nr:hypothetical protein [Salinisphaera japonica]
MPAELPALTERPVYPVMRRMRRAVLRRLGRWSRGAYDVRLVYDQGQPIYKKVVFNSDRQAQQVASALSAFGESIHVPTLRHQADNAIWVDYVAGHAFDPHAADQPEGVAECFTRFALRPSRAVALGETGLADESHQRLNWLLNNAVIAPRLADTLAARINAFDAGLVLRFGFDYADPIAANLLTRADTGQICAIDVKNVRQDALVGLGVAKAHARWLDDDGLRRILSDWQSQGLADVVAAFDFIRLYERIERVARQAVTEKRSRGAIRKQNNKADKLEALLD